MKNIEEMLKALKAKGAIGSALISKDSTIISTDVSNEMNLEVFAIMMATMMGAAVTAYSELNKAPPRVIIAESEDSKIVLQNTEGKVFLAVILPKDKDEEEFLSKSEEILRSLDDSK